jgi:hypothetical protein
VGESLRSSSKLKQRNRTLDESIDLLSQQVQDLTHQVQELKTKTSCQKESDLLQGFMIKCWIDLQRQEHSLSCL